ncbi:MAG: DegQ family serine endoprotease [Gammaproteobacteria bacterium]|jgi:serine protease Do|nr:DegQ family serine endoprotease [Gammaproteobacteria bacterium]
MIKQTLRLSVLGTFALLLAVSRLSIAGSLPDFTELVEAAAPAVVNISTTREVSQRQSMSPFGFPDNGQIPEIFRHFFERQFPSVPKEQEEQQGRPRSVPQSLGSGFLISEDGYILTNHHVIAEADEILVSLNDRRQLPAELIGSDERSDLALLKIDADKLPHLVLADSDALKVGEWVLAIGSPFGFDYSVTAGIVSAKGRDLQSETYVPFIQTDVAINPGNSGGPLFNLAGEVVGINSQIYTRSGGFMGLSFAVPSNLATSIVAQLRDSGEVNRGWLGVHIQEVSQDLAESFGLDKAIGALIAEVVEDSPAEAAGLQAGDIITHVDGREVIKSGHVVHHIGALLPGQEVDLTLVRDGVSQQLEVTIGSLADAEAQAEQRAKTKDVYVERLGLTVLPLDEDQANDLRLSFGVVISAVDEDTALELDLRAGDIITSVANFRVTDPQQFAKLAKALPNGRSIAIRIVRNGRSMYQAFRLNN